MDAEHANPTFDGNAAPTEPRVRLWFGKLGSSSNANSDRQRHRVTVNGELAIRPLLMLPTKNGQSYQALVDASKASGAT